MFKEGVRDILDKLDQDLIGLIPVKQRVREIAALLVLDKMRGQLGFDTSVPSLHMCFTGAPGTGKTTGEIPILSRATSSVHERPLLESERSRGISITKLYCGAVL